MNEQYGGSTTRDTHENWLKRWHRSGLARGWRGALSWTSVVGMMGWLVGVCGCDSRSGGGGLGEARYPRLERVTEPGPATSGAAVGSNSVAALLQFPAAHGSVLSGIQSEHSPGTLWHSTADQVSVFGDLARIGLGAPTFLAYSSPTGIATVRPGGVMTGDQMRENWLLAAFPGAAGWTDWDSPWAVFFQNRPRHVALETNTVTIAFDGPAGFWTMMPLYGVYRPPQQGREMLKAQGLKEKGLLTWEWPLVVARDPLTRLRYWAGATRRFPIRVGGGVAIQGKKGSVTLRERFEWFEIPDAWSTRAVGIAPISPALGLVLTRGQTFPVQFSKAPFDFEMPTVYGPIFGVPETSEYSMAFAVLRYINETERVAPPEGGNRSAAVSEAVDRLQRLGREVFSSVDAYRPEGGNDWNSVPALNGYLWQARMVEFLDESTHSNAIACLRRAMWERVRVPDVNPAADRERLSAWIQAVWAVAHATGDRDLVRQRWPLWQRTWDRLGPAAWVGFGRGDTTTLGDGVAPVLAWTRLAWLAGDLESYRLGCGAVARECALLYGRVRGGAWFREQQPWQPGPPMPEGVVPRRLLGGTAGWELAGPGYPASTTEPWPGERWVRFLDGDVARFCRDHLAAEIRRDVAQMEQALEKGRLAAAGVAGLNEMGFTAPGSTRRLSLENPPLATGMASEIIARCLGVVRAEGLVRTERLIPAVELDGLDAEGSDVPTEGHLIQTVEAGSGHPPTWPRLRWGNWVTPTGAVWDVGDVRAGNDENPRGVSRRAVNHGRRWDVDAAGTQAR